MKILSGIFILYISIIFGCNSGNQKIVVSAVKFNSQDLDSVDGSLKPLFNKLQSYISLYKPDIIFFEESVCTEECNLALKSKGYSFIPLFSSNSDSLFLQTPILLKESSFNLLGSSYYIYENDSLVSSENKIEWFNLKNKKTGHVFYVFNIKLQDVLSDYQSVLIAYDLLNRIDQISAGLPIILIGNFKDKNRLLKNMLTEKWVNLYPLKEIRPDLNSDFLVNDFFKITNSFQDKSKDSLVKNVVIKFFIHSQKVTKSTTGKILPSID